MAELNISIIIISFNTKDLLKNCIKSVYETTKNLSYEIIVVDNASTDDSPEMAEREFTEILLIRNTENLGFARANNQAIKVAKGKYVLLLNSDTIMKEGAIEKLVQFIEEHPGAAAVGPKVINLDGSLQNKGFIFPSIIFSFIILLGINRFFSDKKKRRLFPKFYWDENDVREVDYLEGSCLLLKKEALDKIGFLPEVYFMYFEETEWCYRAKKSKYEIWYVPIAEVIHLRSSAILNERTVMFNKSLILFYKRNIGILKGILISVIMISASVLNLFRVLTHQSNKIEQKVIKEELKKHVNLLKGLIS